MKAIIAVLVLIAAVTLLLGCTAPAGKDNNALNAVKVNSASDAANTLNDVSTDITGISNSLNSIDRALSDTNSPAAP